MEITSPPQSLSETLFSESQRALRSQPRQLLALFALFLVLPSAVTLAFLTFQSPLLYHTLLDTTNIFAPDHHTPNWLLPALSAVACFLFDSAFSSCAVGSITYTVFHGVHGERPVKLTASICSLAASFFPLLATTLLLRAIALAISVAALLASLLIAVLLGFRNIDVYSSDFLFSFGLVSLLVSLVIYLQADWSLASVITAVEPSIWGLESLRLSKNLIAGRESRSVAVSMSFVFGFSQALTVLAVCYIVIAVLDDQWASLAFPLALILVNSTVISSLRIRHIAVKTLLYIHCKASAKGYGETQEVMATKYVILAVDDEKVDNSVVSVV